MAERQANEIAHLQSARPTTAQRDRKTVEPLDSRWPALMQQVEAARYLGVSVEKVREYRHKGFLRPVRWGGQKLYRRADLDAFVMDLEYAE